VNYSFNKPLTLSVHAGGTGGLIVILIWLHYVNSINWSKFKLSYWLLIFL